MKSAMSPHKEDFLFQRNLEKEIDLWLKEGIILPDQKQVFVLIEIFLLTELLSLVLNEMKNIKNLLMK